MKDLSSAFETIRIHEDTVKHSVLALVSGKVTGHYVFNKGFYGLADMPVILREKLDKTLNFRTAAWQEDITVVTRGSAEENECRQNQN